MITPLQHSNEILDSIMQAIPYCLYRKNTESVFVSCNEKFAQTAGFQSSTDILGKTDYDMPWAKSEADWYVYCDKQVMKDGPKINYIETQVLPDGTQKFVFASKLPWLDDNNKILGLQGVYFVIEDPSQFQNSFTLKNFIFPYPIKQTKKYPLNINSTIIYLSPRELDCIQYLIKGKTAKQIGKILNISHRTIETYIQNLKIKFNCNSKSELIAFLWDNI